MRGREPYLLRPSPAILVRVKLSVGRRVLEPLNQTEVETGAFPVSGGTNLRRLWENINRCTFYHSHICSRRRSRDDEENIGVELHAVSGKQTLPVFFLRPDLSLKIAGSAFHGVYGSPLQSIRRQ